jgi:hypothetical protein
MHAMLAPSLICRPCDHNWIDLKSDKMSCHFNCSVSADIARRIEADAGEIGRGGYMAVCSGTSAVPLSVTPDITSAHKFHID